MPPRDILETEFGGTNASLPIGDIQGIHISGNPAAFARFVIDDSDLPEELPPDIGGGGMVGIIDYRGSMLVFIAFYFSEDDPSLILESIFRSIEANMRAIQPAD